MNKICILNLDNSILKQKNFLEKAYSCYNLEVIHLIDEAGYIRYWISKKNIEKLNKKLPSSFQNTITFYGSGDFHHISAIILERFKNPLNLLVFDCHPDWDGFWPYLSCGSWIKWALKRNNINKIFILGTSSLDLKGWGLFTAYLKGLNNKRLEVYPYFMTPSKLYFRKLKDLKSIELKRGLFFSTVYWTNLKEKNINFILEILDKISLDSFYISIDKDCLLNNFAFTNWEEGQINIDWLLNVLRLIREKKNIVGVDITGDYSPIELKGKLKKIFSFFDHPKKKLLDLETINKINETTNIKLLEIFS